MRSSALLAALLVAVTFSQVSVSAQSPLDQLKTYTDPSAAKAKAATTPATPAKGTAAGFPDIAGLRIGMPLRDAFTVLQTQHPAVKLGMYPLDIPGIDKPVLEGFSYGWETLAFHPEKVIVDVTPPPGQQVVWKVRRYLSQQKIYRANVLASLREKYGKEMATTPAVATDAQISEMWWILDEQGHPAKLPPPGGGYQFADQRALQCGQKLIYGNDPGSSWFAPNNLDGLLKNLDPNDWCTQSGIALHAFIGGGDIVMMLNIDMFDIPLAAHSGSAEMTFVNDLAKRQQQQQIDQSKQAKPKL
jgi:hypothetical protein